MSTPLADIGRPAADPYREGRKLYLVPLFSGPRPQPPTAPEEGGEETRQDDPEAREFADLLSRYWTGAEEHVARLEATLGRVDRLYHEGVDVAGDEGDKLLELVNPYGFTLMRSRLMAGAVLEATEDSDIIMELTDWLSCFSLGLNSRKAATLIYEAYLDAVNRRYEHISAQVDRTLGEDERAVLSVRDDHRIQFPADIQVFYVAPPALDELRRWLAEHVQSAAARE